MTGSGYRWGGWRWWESGGQVSVATGIMVSGVPVGEDEYVRETVRGLVEKAVSKITQIKHGLQLVSPQSLLTLTQYSLQPLLDFHCQCIYPTQITGRLAAFDDAVLSVLTSVSGPALGTDEIARARLRLPVCKKGGGVRERNSEWYSPHSTLVPPKNCSHHR